jgi:molecular chaperone GrpE
MSEMTEMNESEQSGVDPSDSGGSETVGQPSVEERLKTLQADSERFKDLAMRTQADFDNFRKRSAREKEEAVKFANGSLLERLIPVIDNFELGLSAARVEADSSPIFKGMEMVAKQLMDFLQQSGVEAVVAEGVAFDPNVHEAVGQLESETVPEGIVLRQLRKGYRLKERLLRPATVMISKGAPESAA